MPLAFCSRLDSFIPLILLGLGGLNDVVLAILSDSSLRPGFAY